MGHCLGITFEAYPREYAAIGLNLPYGKTILEAKALNKIQSILGHMTRALAISARYSSVQAAHTGLSAVMSKLQCAAAIIDHDGHVLDRNTRFEDLERDGLGTVGGRLRCARPECQKGLDLLIRSATGQPFEPGHDDLALISRPAGAAR
jgi:hypothetical protein